ncbi:MAG: pentapeptide repeat-containing protein [Aliarcobacter sp.]|nr:pentapeptide repeat-containing protein [Aliarcobacter sp.]
MCKCSQKNCDLEVFENNDKCILHCEKDEWKLDAKENQYFSDCLKNLISEYKKTDDYKNGYLLELESLVYPLHNFAYFKEIEVHFEDSKFINDVVLSSKDTKFIQFFNCDFYSNFRILGNLGTFDKELIIRECIFHKLEDTNVIFNLSGTNFEKYVDLRETKFYRKTEFDDSSFEDNVFFNNCYFSDKLNLENTIFYEKVNFFNIKLDNGISNRETARIIKDSFEKQNNIIAANEFYALEMKEREKELEEDIKEGKNFLEWLVFKIHGISSNHSQDWLLALYWIFIIGFISSYYDFNLIQYEGKYVHYELSLIFKTIGLIFVVLFLNSICKIKDKLVNGSYFIICFYLVYIYSTEDYLLSLFSKTINPFSVMKTNDAINGIQLFFKIIIAYLIYQLIISIRQNTRRK